MIVYLVLLGIVLFLSVVANFFDRQKDKNILILGGGFLLTLILLCLRKNTVGTDIHNYIDGFFIKDGESSWREILLNYDEEYLFHILCKILYSICEDERFFLICTSIIIVLPLAITYIKNVKRMPLLVFLLFMGMDMFAMIFSGLRQAMAVSFVFAAYPLFIKRKTVKYLLVTVFASLFHISALVGILFYIAYNIKISRNVFVWFFIPVFLIAYLLRHEIIDLMIRLLAYINPRYGNYDYEAATGGGLSFFVYFITVVVMYIFDTDDEQFIRMRSVMLLAAFIQMFTTVHTLAGRITLYIVPMFPLVVEMILNSKKVRYLGYSGVGGFCYYGYAVYKIIMLLLVGSLNIVPYLFFWQ